MISIVAVVLVLAALGGGAAWLATRTHHGTGHPALAAPPAAPKAIDLCQSCAHGYNPLGSPSDEHPDASLAIDGDPSTYWSTQTYYNDALNKAGTGIYVDANPGTTALKVRVLTSTPGFTATIYARNGPPPLHWPDPGWVKVSAPTVVGSKQAITLTSGSTRYRYFLLWITSLGGHGSVQVNELTLYGR